MPPALETCSGFISTTHTVFDNVWPRKCGCESLPHSVYLPDSGRPRAPRPSSPRQHRGGSLSLLLTLVGFFFLPVNITFSLFKSQFLKKRGLVMIQKQIQHNGRSSIWGLVCTFNCEEEKQKRYFVNYFSERREDPGFP